LAVETTTGPLLTDLYHFCDYLTRLPAAPVTAMIPTMVVMAMPADR